MILSLLLSALLNVPADTTVVPSADTLQLDGTTLVAHRRSGAIASQKADGTIKLELKRLNSTPRVFGSSDPLRTAQSLPGISTNSEIESGMHIQGTEIAHNYVSLGGAPVYGSSHLFGLFSAFIPSHFETMDFSTLSSKRNRLGGEIMLDTADSIARKVSLQADAGLFFTQGTLCIPLSDSSSLSLSGRGSYLNALYGDFLKIGDNHMHYGFGDGNLSWNWRISPRDLLKVDVYHGSDKLSVEAHSYDVPLDLDWNNTVATARWISRRNMVKTTRNLYVSDNRMSCSTGKALSLPTLHSRFTTVGYRMEHLINDLCVGFEIMSHLNTPLGQNEKKRRANEETLFAKYTRSIGDLDLTLEAVQSILALPKDQDRYAISPVVRLHYNLYNAGAVELRVGRKTQNLFQTGVSDSGFPSEFWMVCGGDIKPQKSNFISLDYSNSLIGGKYSFSAETYFRRLENQVLYRGTLVDYYDASYSISDHLSQTNGLNYGATLMLSRNSGKLTGWVAYSVGRSLLDGGIPTSHERIHELNAVLNYNGKRWDAGASFVLASGTPYTAAKSFYIISEMLIVNYGDLNASRLPAYSRLDLSANWYFIRREGREFGANLSIYNALAHDNILSYRTKLNSDTGYFYNSAVSFSLKFMPSISLFYKF